jgi:hypothetical protein
LSRVPEGAKKKNNGFTIVPYVFNDGMPTILDSFILNVWDRIEQDGLHRRIFFDGVVQCREDFLQFVKENPSRVFFCFHEGLFLGVSWLTDVGFEPRAKIHHCVLKWAWGRLSLGAGLLVLDFIDSLMDSAGEPVFRVLVGETPVENRLACRFAKLLGFKEVGVIPQYLYNARECRCMDALITYRLNPQVHEEE